MQQFTVDQADAGRRLDVVAAERAGVSRNRVQQWLYEGALTVNQRSARPSQLVVPGDQIEIVAGSETVRAPKQIAQAGLPIIYEDEDIVVVDKPAGIAVHATSKADQEATVADFARAWTTDTDPERPGIVHRLDRETSGLLVIARHPMAKIFMQHAFAERQVSKTYHALVVGRLNPLEAVIRLPIARAKSDPTRREVSPSGKAAETSYKTIATYSGYSLVEARPRTGRTHQLRVHFAALGHPIAGDTRYGQPRLPVGLARHFLHASALEFEAPSGRKLKLTSPLPGDLDHFLDALGEEACG